MTGFGLGSAELGEGRLLVEVRALNHRYQDIRVRAHGPLADQAFFLEQLSRQELGRGRYDISVRVEGTVGASAELSEERVRAVFASLKRLNAELCPERPVGLEAVLALPDVVQPGGVDSDEARASLTSAFASAKRELEAMRTFEGDALKDELAQRLGLFAQLVAKLSEGADALLQHQTERLEERAQKLLKSSNIEIDPARLAQEIALLADKSDITEELVRLESHRSQFAHLIDESEPVGRRLDFLLQEMGREINTIGSKSQHAPVAHLVVEAKAELERLREQAQNVD